MSLPMFSICKLPLLVLAACFLLSCSGQHHPEASVELKVTTEAVYWKGVRLDFNQTAEEWVRVLDVPYVFGDELPQVRLARFSNRRIIFPSLGIDIKVASDIPYHEGSVIPDPMKRPIEVVRVYLNPTNTATDLLKFYSDKVKQHPHHKMSFPYAINFYGTLIGRETPKSYIRENTSGIVSSRHFNTLKRKVWNRENINAVIFFVDNPSRPRMLEITPSEVWDHRIKIQYFGYSQQQPRKTQ